MVIDTKRRHTGIGKMLLKHVLEQYPGSEIYLLTESAAGFFRKQGFREIDREKVPASVQKHPQFSFLCPGSATGMKLKT